MQVVRAHHLFGLLGESAVLEGKEFRCDRRVHDVVQDPTGLALEQIVRRPLDEITNEGLGHAGIHVVHRHVVAVEGHPAECRLAEVAGANHHPTNLVGDIHEDLCSLAGLGVLVHDVVGVRVVTDVVEMGEHGISDRDLPGRGSESGHEPECVLVRPVRGAQAGHGDCLHTRPVDAENVESPACHQHRKGGVETTTDAENDPLAAGVPETLGEAGRLDGENFLAVRPAPGGVRWHERVCVNRTLEVCERRRGGPERNRHHPVWPRIGACEARVRCPLVQQLGEVDVGRHDVLTEFEALGLPENDAVLGNEGMTGEHYVHRALAGARSCVEIRGETAG
ncbi:unannotated protein [freshwater metagenome]|uniref:Unannotated protein n=1 Tax=freshwater metagenome TaxID=449393 RepID=A0A6J6PI22_9ZZZZ